jgi:hypothetical protein
MYKFTFEISIYKTLQQKEVWWVFQLCFNLIKSLSSFILFTVLHDKALRTANEQFDLLFNYMTTGAFTTVGPLLAPVVKHDFQMSWALLIIS